MNAELQQAWVDAGGSVVDNRHRLGEVERAITALRSALEKGVDDIDWVNQRLRELSREQESLRRAESSGRTSIAPTVDTKMAQLSTA